MSAFSVLQFPSGQVISIPKWPMLEWKLLNSFSTNSQPWTIYKLWSDCVTIKLYLWKQSVSHIWPSWCGFLTPFVSEKENAVKCLVYHRTRSRRIVGDISERREEIRHINLHVTDCTKYSNCNGETLSLKQTVTCFDLAFIIE